MKKYFQAILFAIINFSIIGFLLPFLISYPSDFLVGLGFATIILLPIIDFCLIKKFLQT